MARTARNLVGRRVGGLPLRTYDRSMLEPIDDPRALLSRREAVVRCLRFDAQQDDEPAEVIG